VKGVCASCRKQKYEVHGRDSALIPSMKILMCKTCIRKGHEPRHLIILAARSGKVRQATPFITGHLYDGEAIVASDILKSN
jgi:hypothetical protein